MGKPQAPSSPDYAGAAKAQGEANLQSGVQSAQISTPFMETPYGGQGVDWSGQRTGSPTIPYIHQWLTPTGQATVDQQQQAGLGLANIANTQTRNIGTLLDTPFSFGGQTQTQLPSAGPINPGTSLSIPQLNTAPPLQGYVQPPPQTQTPNAPSVAPTPQSAPQAQQTLSQLLPGADTGGMGGLSVNDFAARARDVLGRSAEADRQGAYNPQLKSQSALYQALAGQLGLKNDANGMFTAEGWTPPGSASPQGGSQLPAAGGSAAPNLPPPTAGTGGPAQFVTGFDESNVAQMPVNAGMTAQQAIMSRLNPDLARQRTSAETQLINQGLRPGGEAYDNAADLIGRQENDARIQATLQGLGLDFMANQQGFAQAGDRADFNNRSLMGQYGLGFDSQRAQNDAQQQGFNQSLLSGQFGNTAIAQALAMALTQRNQPFNEITALMSGSQVQTPSFPGYGGQSVAPAPTFAGTQAQGQWDQNIYNQKVAQRNAMMGGLYGLGGAGITGLFGLGGGG